MPTSAQWSRSASASARSLREISSVGVAGDQGEVVAAGGRCNQGIDGLDADGGAKRNGEINDRIIHRQFLAAVKPWADAAEAMAKAPDRLPALGPDANIKMIK
jgi:hypothetical protein